MIYLFSLSPIFYVIFFIIILHKVIDKIIVLTLIISEIIIIFKEIILHKGAQMDSEIRKYHAN